MFDLHPSTWIGADSIMYELYGATWSSSRAYTYPLHRGSFILRTGGPERGRPSVSRSLLLLATPVNQHAARKERRRNGEARVGVLYASTLYRKQAHARAFMLHRNVHSVHTYIIGTTTLS